MKKLLLPILLMHILCNSSFAQKQGQAKIDSLQAVLKTAMEDTAKVKLLTGLSKIYYTINPDEGIKCGEQALTLAKKLQWKKGIAQAQGNLGLNYRTKSDYPKAREYGFESLKGFEEIGDKKGVAGNLVNIGSSYYYEGNFPKALEFDFKALKILDEDLHDKDYLANDLGNIGNIYYEEKDDSMALNYLFRALKLNEELGKKGGIATDRGNIGAIFWDQKNYSKALEYLFNALKIEEELGDKSGIGRNLTNIGGVYADENDFTKSIEYKFKALKINEEVGDKYSIDATLGDIGYSYLKEGKLGEADKFLHNGLKLASEIRDLDGIKDINANLSDLYSKEGNWKKAFDYYKASLIAKDSINNEEKAKKQTRLEMNYEFEKTQAADSAKHEKEMAVANVENKRQKLFRNVSIGGFSVMLLFAGVFFTQRNHISKGKKRSDELLLNILPSETAEELKATGTAKAKSYDMVTVLFTDFKNFTQASENMNAEELVNEIHYCYSEFDKIISKHGIEKIKTIGDSYMCAGGLPVENKTNPIEVVRAALEIQQFIYKEKEERQKNNKPFFEIRIGINSGPVVAGIVGIKKFAYDIWGDTVNIASRMESSGEVGKVNISGSMYDLVKDKFTCTHRGKIDAKNKGMIDMYFVEGENA